MASTVGDIELYMGPQEVGGPDDLGKAIVDFIDGADKRLDIAVQELESMEIAQAIIRARQRKVVVRLVLEGDYLRVARALQNPFEPGGTNETNRLIHDAILRSNINVKSDFNPSIFHQKFIIRDGSALLTGSTNFTDTGTGNNFNHLIIIRHEDVADIYRDEFKEIMQGHFGKLDEGHDPAPDVVRVSEVPIKILFAPDHNPEMEIMKQMAKARKRIDFAMFTFSESSGIDDQMIALSRAGIKIRGALDGSMANFNWAARHNLLEEDYGIKLWGVRSRGSLGKMHHKLMVIDEQVIIAGSFNYTGPANRLNDENIMILGDLGDTSDYSVPRQKALASYALAEIDRIIETYGYRLT
jgi:phosphatidylserine/phosphatidylglycerophosphate/cardiolipin synthase-like enzyme